MTTPELITLPVEAAVIPALTEVVAAKGWEAAILLSAIGAVRAIECGYYDLPKQEYRLQQYVENYEVLSLTGNYQPKEGSGFWHLHGVFSDADNQVFGGHVASLVVAVTLECVLVPTTAQPRAYDERSGLFLLPAPSVLTDEE